MEVGGREEKVMGGGGGEREVPEMEEGKREGGAGWIRFVLEV